LPGALRGDESNGGEIVALLFEKCEQFFLLSIVGNQGHAWVVGHERWFAKERHGNWS
jgi:hypothetical protein